METQNWKESEKSDGLPFINKDEAPKPKTNKWQGLDQNSALLSNKL